MFDTTKLMKNELEVLATYILPQSLPATDPFDRMIADLAPLGVRKLKGTIGVLKGRFFENVFLQSNYWQIVSSHFSQQGICPLCKQARTLIIAPVYHHLGVSHLQEHLRACSECHLIVSIGDFRLWRPQIPDYPRQVTMPVAPRFALLYFYQSLRENTSGT